MIELDPAIGERELPAVFPSPFDGTPHPIARRAAERLLAELRELRMDEGKMFGVLVVRAPDGRIGYLKAFSGMLGGRWLRDGFAPPLFDAAAWDRMWPAGQAALRAHDQRLAAIDADSARAKRRVRLESADNVLAAQSRMMRERHKARKAARDEARRAGGADLEALARESRADSAERKAFDKAVPHAALIAQVKAEDDERAAIVALRADESRALMKQVHEAYVIASYAGERRPLRELFAPGEPPGGAGDCAGPKLLGEAYRRGLQPIAMAEVWWGPPPATGGRIAGVFYPSCRGKCGPLLPHMLGGLAVAPAPEYGAVPVPAHEPRIVYEDDRIVIVDKPAWLLSIPGRSKALEDSVQTRLRARWPDLTVVHRLDLETSGILMAAKDTEMLAALQGQFARREIDKRYVAWLAGEVRGEHGTIELALRVDVDDRPRQIVDPVHGKPALTEWRVDRRDVGKTRVIFVPRTGRTHQLRVHAAHPDGLGIPIVGDRLYGTPGERLQLHAETLDFRHPVSGRRIAVVRPAPW